jgi:general secretion pathway protein L
MAEFLVIRLGEKPQDPCNWIAVDSSGARRSPPVIGPLSEARIDVGERSVIVLVASVDVLTTTVDIPIRGGAKLQAALPFALEESMADDVDKLHFAAGTRRGSGRIPVSVVDREKLSEWLSRLRDAGIEPSSIIAESYGLARIPGTISVMVAENQVVINDGADIELVMQGVSPGDALTAIGAFDDDTDGHEKEASETLGLPRHVLVYCAPEDEERYQHDWIAMRHELDSLDVKLLADGVLPRLAVTVATGAGVNLLQGSYGRKTDFSSMFEPWKYAAMLLLAFGLVAVVGKAADFYSLRQQHTSLQQQFLLEYQQFVPGAAMPKDPVARVESLRRQSGTTQAPQTFLRSLEHLSQAIQQNQSAAIEAISFRAGVVDVRLTAPDVATLDNIQKAVSQSGQFKATIKSTDQDGDKVKSRIQIQAGGE